MSRQYLLLLPVFVLLLHWIEKRSSRGCLLEHLESSVTNIVMRGLIVSQLLWVETEKQRKKGEKILMMNFTFFSLTAAFFSSTPSLLP